jgi:hypothetical protein
VDILFYSYRYCGRLRSAEASAFNPCLVLATLLAGHFFHNDRSLARASFVAHSRPERVICSTRLISVGRRGTN